jgi:hypothetical protein
MIEVGKDGGRGHKKTLNAKSYEESYPNPRHAPRIPICEAHLHGDHFPKRGAGFVFGEARPQGRGSEPQCSSFHPRNYC